MPKNWDEESQIRLLLTIIELSDSRPTWLKVAQTMGPEYTMESVRQQYAALRKKSNASSGTVPAKRSHSKTEEQDEIDDTAIQQSQGFRAQPRRTMQTNLPYTTAPKTSQNETGVVIEAPVVPPTNTFGNAPIASDDAGSYTRKIQLEPSDASEIGEEI